MAKDPALLFYFDKWITATQGMRVEAKSWYLEMILYQYDKGPLPSDLDELASICRIRPSEFDLFKQVFEQVLKQKFKQNESGKLENEFTSEILQKRQRFIEKRSNAGKLSYVLKYFRNNFKMSKGLEQFIKDNIDLDFDIKNEQVLKQVFKQKSELYINVNEDINKDYIKIYNSVKTDFNLKKEYEEQILLWLKYKSEKGQSYKKTGLKTLIKTILLNYKTVDELKKAIDYSITNNYSGLFTPNSKQSKTHINHDTDY
jgi:hypothetical protein